MMEIDSSFKIRYQQAKLFYYGNALARRIIHKNLAEPKFQKKVMTAEEGNLLLKDMIQSGKPFAAARYGGTEAKTIADVLYSKVGGKIGGLSDKTLERIMNLSGFFPAEKEMLNQFTELYLQSSEQIDLLGVWNIVMQDFLADKCAYYAQLSELRVFEPYYFQQPWSKALEEKKVVVIHPFADTIEKQYRKREILFVNKEILPKFDLRTVKAVQTLAGESDERFATWFDALSYMYDETMKEDFDVALIGCGAYGFPLAAKIKQAGKQAIHIGGSLQLFFGIKGKRWDEHEFISKLYNDAWTRPSDKDKVQKSEVVEGSCYW